MLKDDWISMINIKRNSVNDILIVKEIERLRELLVNLVDILKDDDLSYAPTYDEYDNRSHVIKESQLRIENICNEFKFLSLLFRNLNIINQFWSVKDILEWQSKIKRILEKPSLDLNTDKEYICQQELSNLLGIIYDQVYLVIDSLKYNYRSSLNNTILLQQYPIFISYAREDIDQVLKKYNYLSAKGFNLWMDIKNIPGGTNWKTEINKAIKKCTFFMAFISPNYHKRGMVQVEIKEALKIWYEKLSTDIYLLPVRLSECNVPVEFASWP